MSSRLHALDHSTVFSTLSHLKSCLRDPVRDGTPTTQRGAQRMEFMLQLSELLLTLERATPEGPRQVQECSATSGARANRQLIHCSVQALFRFREQ